MNDSRAPQPRTLSPRQHVLRNFPRAVCRKGMFAANRFHVYPETYENGWTGRRMVSGRWIGTGLTAREAWADAERTST